MARSLRSVLTSAVNVIVAYRRLIALCLIGAAVGAAATVSLCWLQGCAAGRNDATGEIVVGVGVAKLTESTNQAIGQLADLVLPGAGGAVGLIAAAGIGWARSYAKARAATESRRAADESWDNAAATYSAAPPRVAPVVAAGTPVPLRPVQDADVDLATQIATDTTIRNMQTVTGVNS